MERHSTAPDRLWNAIPPPAEELPHRAIEIFETAYGPRTPFLAEALNRLGSVLLHAGDIPSAEEILERAGGTACGGDCGSDHALFADVLIQLARLRRAAGDVEAAGN